MNGLLFRTRVAVLWVAAAVAASASLLFYLLMPGALAEVLDGTMEGEPLNDAMGFFFAALVLIPVMMAALAMLVGDRVNRYLNLIVGLLFALFATYGVVSHVSDGEFNGHVLMAALGGLLTYLITGLSAVGLRRSASAGPTPALGTPAPAEETRARASTPA